jgi:hypothetical protein
MTYAAAAIEHISDKGYAAFSTFVITLRTGMAEGAAFRRFTGK